MSKSKLINTVHLLLLVFSTGFIASIQYAVAGLNLAVMASILVIVSERFYKINVRYKYFTLVPFVLLGIIVLLVQFGIIS